MSLGPVGAPTDHQVQHHGILRYELAEQVADRHDGSIIYGDYETVRRLELGIVAAVFPLEELRRQAFRGNPYTQPGDDVNVVRCGAVHAGRVAVGCRRSVIPLSGIRAQQCHGT